MLETTTKEYLYNLGQKIDLTTGEVSFVVLEKPPVLKHKPKDYSFLGVNVSLDNLIYFIDDVTDKQVHGLINTLMEFSYAMGEEYEVRYKLNTFGMSLMRHQFNIGKGDGAITLGWKPNSVPEGKKAYSFRVEFNPSKLDGVRYRMIKFIFAALSQHSYRIKNMDFAIDFPLPFEQVNTRSKTGRQPNRIYGNLYYGDKTKHGHLRKYDKKRELIEKYVTNNKAAIDKEVKDRINEIKQETNKPVAHKEKLKIRNGIEERYKREILEQHEVGEHLTRVEFRVVAEKAVDTDQFNVDEYLNVNDLYTITFGDLELDGAVAEEKGIKESTLSYMKSGDFRAVLYAIGEQEVEYKELKRRSQECVNLYEEHFRTDLQTGHICKEAYEQRFLPFLKSIMNWDNVEGFKFEDIKEGGIRSDEELRQSVINMRMAGEQMEREYHANVKMNKEKMDKKLKRKDEVARRQEKIALSRLKIENPEAYEVYRKSVNDRVAAENKKREEQEKKEPKQLSLMDSYRDSFFKDIYSDQN